MSMYRIEALESNNDDGNAKRTKLIEDYYKNMSQHKNTNVHSVGNIWDGYFGNQCSSVQG